MTNIGDILEIIHTSPDRWRVIRVEGREWRHLARSLEAFTAAHGHREPGVSMRPDPDQPEETDDVWRLWFEKPARTRAEFSAGGEVWTAVIVGPTWWSWSPSRGGRTNGGWAGSEHGVGPGEGILDLAPLLPLVELEVTGDTTFLGRRALHVHAKDRPIDDPYVGARIGIHRFPTGADDYELLLDAERGVALRVEQRRSGRPFHVTEVTAVAFDEELPEQTFLPPGEGDIEYAIEPASREMLLEDAVRHMPFTILVPEHPPVGPPEATVQFAPGAPQLYLRYAISHPHRGDDRAFAVWEAAEPLPEVSRWRWRDTDGVRFVEDDATQPSTLRVRVQRGSTRVDISSTQLAMEELIKMAGSLVPLRSGPPPLVHLRPSVTGD